MKGLSFSLCALDSTIDDICQLNNATKIGLGLSVILVLRFVLRCVGVRCALSVTILLASVSR